MIGLQAVNKLLINSASSDRCADCIGWCSLLGPHSSEKPAQQQSSPLDLAFCAPCSPPPRPATRAAAPSPFAFAFAFAFSAFAYFAVPALLATVAWRWRSADHEPR